MLKKTLPQVESITKMFRGELSHESKRLYTRSMIKFAEFHEITDYDRLSKSTPEEIEDLLNSFIDHLKADKYKITSIKNMLAGIERFFRKNKCTWDQEEIRDNIGRSKDKPAGSEAYTTEDVSKMLQHTSSLRMKAMIHFLASTGGRAGALVDPILRIKHLKKMEDCYAVLVYKNSTEEHYSFLTPEASRSLEAYFEERQQDSEKFVKSVVNGKIKVTREPVKGEVLTPESIVFKTKEGSHMTTTNAGNAIRRIIESADIDRELEDTSKTGKAKLWDKQTLHAFRKRAKTIFVDSGISHEYSERMIGHADGLNKVYFQPTLEKCFEEFKKAIHLLTIDPTQRYRRAIHEKQDEIVLEKTRHATLEARIAELEKVIQLKNRKIEELENSSDLEERMDAWYKKRMGIKDPDELAEHVMTKPI